VSGSLNQASSCRVNVPRDRSLTSNAVLGDVRFGWVRDECHIPDDVVERMASDYDEYAIRMGLEGA